MSLPYSQLLDTTTTSVCEPRQSYSIISERHVQVMWLEQKYFTPLTTVDGKSIEVISPGIWNAEAGPDFKKAHLIIGGKEVYGDVEIHLSDEGWTQHEHHTDPRYNNVCLHLSFWKSKTSKDLITQEGRPLTKGYFEGCLTIPEKKIFYHIDLDLYPYKKFTGAGKCASLIFKKAATSTIESFFQSAAQWRLEKKRNHLRTRVDDPRLTLSAGIAMALGYKQNTEAFLDLFLQLPRSPSFDSSLAVALGSCGFFAEHYRKLWSDSEYYNTLLEIYRSTDIKHGQPTRLALTQVRPLNHPVRRIAYLIHLINDNSMPQLYQRMAAHWEASWPMVKQAKDCRELINDFIQLLPTYEDNYWNHHYTFEKDPRDAHLPLIGLPLKREVLINTFFPLLQESIAQRAIPHEMQAFTKLYASLKSQATGKAKYLKHRLFGDTDKSMLLNRADLLQGAYQLHYDFCLHYEASCEGCPFIERYLATNPTTP